MFRIALKDFIPAASLIIGILGLPLTGKGDTAVTRSVSLEAENSALVVLVSADRRGRIKSYGTGFFIRADGMVVSARHVVQSEMKLVAVTMDGKPHRVVSFIGQSPDYDLAVIQIEGEGYPYLKLSETPPSTNDMAEVISPTSEWAKFFVETNAIPITHGQGIVTSISDLVPGFLKGIQTTIGVEVGQSGSPLLNHLGEVVGVVPYFSNNGTATAAPIAAVKSLLSQSPTPFPQRPRDGKLPLLFDPDFRAGMEAAIKQDWKKAAKRMRRAAKTFPKSPGPLIFLAIAESEHGDWNDVKRYCEAAVRLDEANGFVRTLYGTSLIMLGQKSEGLTELRKGIEFGLQDLRVLASAWSLIAITEAELENEKMAEEALNQVEILSPSAVVQVREKVHFNLSGPGK